MNDLRFRGNGDDANMNTTNTTINIGNNIIINRIPENDDKDDDDDDDDDKNKNKNKNNDVFNMIILILLYTLQGIPMGLHSSLPLIMKEKGVSYEGLSLFSLVSLPFSMKLLWAPLVDSCYFKSIGRRKTWLIPVQLLTGAVMIIGAKYIDSLMGNNNKQPEIVLLSSYFFLLYFLMATQDIAVDGWALTMLSKDNVGYASTCNTFGQVLGILLANQGFIALSDPIFCFRLFGYFIEKGQTLVTLSSFMAIWGWIFISITFLIAFFKSEGNSDEEDTAGLIETYTQAVSIFRLKSVQKLCLILLSCKIAFSSVDGVASFKLQEYGMPKADISTISPILVVVSLILPAVSGNIIATRPLDIFMLGIPLKLLTSLFYWFIIQQTKIVYSDGKAPDAFYFGSLIAVLVTHQIAGDLIFSAMMSFFTKVADPTIGGTYMTLLNTIANLGSKWTAAALWLLPKLTYTSCDGQKCKITLDGYTVQTFSCALIGILWIFLMKGYVDKIKTSKTEDWLLQKNRIN